MSFDEEDPEVAADLALRESSVFDRSRTRVEPAMLATWAPRVAFVGMWRCRGGKSFVCSSMIPVTEETIERWMMFNARLRDIGQSPIDSGEVLRCDRCVEAWRAQRPATIWDRVDAMAKLIQALKNSDRPEEEREIIKQLTAWNHPDVRGLLQAIAVRRATAPKATRSRRGMV